jgi:hypothetical protein
MNPGAELCPAVETRQALMDLPKDLGGRGIDIGATQTKRLAEPQNLRLPLTDQRRKGRRLAAL